MTAATFDPAHRLLAACALGVERGPEAASAAASLYESAALHQLRPQLAARCPAAREALPSLAASAGAHAGHGRFLASQLAEVMRALHAAGVRAMPFKGPAFAMYLGEGPAMREMGDLDLLVEAAGLPGLLAALAAIGFEAPRRSRWLPRSSSELEIHRPGDGLVVEAHWRLAPPWLAAPVSVAELFGGARERDFLGVPVSWPAPEGLLLAHIADGMKSCGCRLRWIADVAAILRAHPGIDGERVGAMASRNGALEMVGIALAALESVRAEAGSGELLPPALAALARRARGRSRPAAALQATLRRLARDVVSPSPLEHFTWALSIADHRPGAALTIARYLFWRRLANLEAKA